MTALQIREPRPGARHLEQIVGPVRPDRRAQIGLRLLDGIGAPAKSRVGPGGPFVCRQIDRPNGGLNAPDALAATVDRPVARRGLATYHRESSFPHVVRMAEQDGNMKPHADRRIGGSHA